MTDEEKIVAHLFKLYAEKTGGKYNTSIEEARKPGSTDPRNETMMRMFSMVEIGERAGSGMYKIFGGWGVPATPRRPTRWLTIPIARRSYCRSFLPIRPATVGRNRQKRRRLGKIGDSCLSLTVWTDEAVGA